MALGVSRNTDANLPAWFREINAGATAGRRNVGIERRIVPSYFWYVGESGPTIGIVRGTPVTAVAFVKLGTTSAGHFRNSGGNIHRKPVGGCTHTEIAVSRARIA